MPGTSTYPAPPPDTVCPHDMVWIPTGEFAMGSEDFYLEESPVRRVSVDGFWMDQTPVTVAEFKRFVEATGYVTTAEQAPDPSDYPDADPSLLTPGSIVFSATAGPVDLRDFREWWNWTPGACWHRPEGPGSSVSGRERNPVVHVSHEDAAAFALWAGKDLPTEAEWERAARGGLEGKIFAWGDEFAPHGRMMANTWQGEFPWQNLRTDGFAGTSPVRSFPANGFGLYDIIGNVWEWTSDWYTARNAGSAAEKPACCIPHNPRVDSPSNSLLPGERVPSKVIKGGSHLCAPNYCLRYRPAARQSETIDTSTSHIGFRCIIRPQE